MFDKLMQAQQMAAQVKEQLAQITLTGEAGNNKVVVTVDANKNFKQIEIADELLNPERKEELCDLIGIAFEKAIANSEQASAAEMQKMMGSMMPGLGSLFGK